MVQDKASDQDTTDLHKAITSMALTMRAAAAEEVEVGAGGGEEGAEDGVGSASGAAARGVRGGPRILAVGALGGGGGASSTPA